MEPTPMPNTDEREAKTIEFSPMGNGTEITGNTPEKKTKDNSKPKKTSFTERIADMVGMRRKDKEKMINGTGKSKTFGTVSILSRMARESKAADDITRANT